MIMIQKIQTTEYLKRVDNMTAVERDDYLKRVGEWRDRQARLLLPKMDDPMAQFQNVLQVSAAWNDAECQAWTEGVRLLTALVATGDTWLPEMIYTKAAKRAVKKLAERLQIAGREIQAPPPTPPLDGRGAAAHYNQGPKRAAGAVANQPQGTPLPSRIAATTAGKPQGTDAAGNGRRLNPAAMNVPTISDAMKQGMVPPRPRHIDQYVHLLPEATQKRAAAYGELMREFDVSREKLRLVMEDAHASDKDREQWAKKVAKLDGQIGDIRKELDREWEKVAASGRVVVDELGMAHLVRTDGEPSGTVADGGDLFGMKPETAVADDNQRKSALLRKWLIDTRYGNKDAEKRAKQQEKWREKYREMVRLGGMEAVTEKVREAAKHYEIDLDSLNTNDHK